MDNIRTLLSIVHSDFLERSRSYSFLVTIGISMLIAYIFVPPVNAKYAVVVISDYRGIYNSAWIGATVAMSATSSLMLFGFFLVKNAIERDRNTRVGQIIATTPLSKLSYVTGKFLSNYFVLCIIVFITFSVSLAMQFIRNESADIKILQLFLPFLLVVLPAMTIVASMAILFESVALLRGGIGNIIYFFIWSRLLNYTYTAYANIFCLRISISSLMGSEIFFNSMTKKFISLFPSLSVRQADGIMTLDNPLKTFRWEGVAWTSDIILGRLFWLLIAAVLVGLAAVLFRGFDKVMLKERFNIFSMLRRNQSTHFENDSKMTDSKPISSLSPITLKFSFIDILSSELKLVFKGQRWWWYLVAAAFIMLSLLLPIEFAKSLIAPLSWTWPILIWSSMGVREIRDNTRDIVFSSPFPLQRQMPASWIAGFAVALLTGSGFGVRLAASGNLIGFIVWGIGAMFIPSLALALGVWTQTSKSFEVIYLMIMFIGILNGVKIFDFMGVIEGSIISGMPIIYLSITVVLILTTIWGRKRQLRH